MNEVTTIISLGVVDGLLIPVVVGLVQVIKTMGLPTRFAPAVGLFLGVGLEAVVATAVPTSIAHVVIVGFIVGLSALGLYSGTKTTATPSVGNE